MKKTAYRIGEGANQFRHRRDAWLEHHEMDVTDLEGGLHYLPAVPNLFTGGDLYDRVLARSRSRNKVMAAGRKIIVQRNAINMPAPVRRPMRAKSRRERPAFTSSTLFKRARSRSLSRRVVMASPSNRASTEGTCTDTLPGVCPGVWMIRGEPGTSRTCPGATA